ncbi:hypothetical protein FQR65_LT02718 [Abscondita terminalis]|nr:hypothetical protein FQR65_LT02718 [Abscondita terminalis]
MSIRAVGSRLFKHGQNIVRNICRRDYNQNTTNIAEKINVIQGVPSAPAPITNTTLASRTFALRNVGLQFSIHARRIFVDNVLNRVTNTLASELRKKAARRILFGDSRPFLAFVGVSLASGTGILTKEEELEGVCWEIREAISKFKWTSDSAYIGNDVDTISLKDMDIGKPIAKGSNAVVYEANFKVSEKNIEPPKNDFDVSDSYLKYPLAVKMMFNYDVQSNAMAILQAMYRETVPARRYSTKNNINAWEMELMDRRIPLPPHPNIVNMLTVFTDYIPDLKGNKGLYPAALPPRIYSEGEGRNMSLFLVMNRYNCTLKEYCAVESHSQRVAALLFAQLLEGIVHLNLHGIAHRDLKSDNILLDTSEKYAPILVITDFGCCLADKNHGLALPYNVYDIDKGGNAALMAPEIILQKPGTFSVLNYSRSDLWTAGTIAYEIFDNYNPFYDNSKFKKLRNVDYNEDDLPALTEEVSPVIRKLVKHILKRNPNQRLDPELAANIMQVFLWGPSVWLKKGSKIPSSAEILQWLLCLATKVLCEGSTRLHSEDMLRVACFLKRFNNVVQVDLCYNAIGDLGIEYLADGCLSCCCNNLEHLNLMGCDITARGIKAIAECWNTLRLRSLRLASNKIGTEGGILVSELLGKSETLLHVDVGDTDQTVATLNYFMGVMRNDIGTINCLQIFDYSRVIPMSKKYQYEPDHIATSIGEMLKVNTSLLELHIQKNQLDGHDVELLLIGLKENETLLFLDLGYNRIGDHGIELLAKWLSVKPVLLGLNVAGNGIGNTGARALSFGIPFSKLRLLDITFNKISTPGLIDILNSIKKPYVLRYFFFWGNKIEHETNLIIERMLLSGVLVQQQIDVELYTDDDVIYAAYYPSNHYKHRYYCVLDHGCPAELRIKRNKIVHDFAKPRALIKFRYYDRFPPVDHSLKPDPRPCFDCWRNRENF